MSEDDRALVYGEVGGDLVFMSEQEAQRRMRLRGAIEGSTTVGELREQLTEEQWEGIAEALEDTYGRDEPPGPLEPFDCDEHLPAYREEPATYLGWAKQGMLDWVPDEVYDLGVERDTVLSGPYLELRPEQEHEVVAVFTGLGYTCRRDDQLVEDAEGWT